MQTLPLHPPVEETAEVLQFVKKKALLKVSLFDAAISALRQSASNTFATVSGQDCSSCVYLQCQQKLLSLHVLSG